MSNKTNAVTINGQSLPVRIYQGQEVVTVKDIAAVHQTPIRNIQINFERNRKHFIKGVDYFALKGKKVTHKLFVGSQITQINVFTETGYMMLAKSLTDDLSWKVQRELVKQYFNQTMGQTRDHDSLLQNENKNLFFKMYPLLDERFKKVVYYRVEKGLTQEETALVLGMSRTKCRQFELDLKKCGFPMPTRCKNNQSKFEIKQWEQIPAEITC